MSSYPTAEEYIRWGLTARGVRHVHSCHRDPTLPAIDATACSTTANVCHTRVKALTTPASWEHRPTLTTEVGRQRYTHEYVEAATGRAQPGAPDGTASLCELLAADPATAVLVGRPTVFHSHAWKYAFGDLA